MKIDLIYLLGLTNCLNVLFGLIFKNISLIIYSTGMFVGAYAVALEHDESQNQKIISENGE